MSSGLATRCPACHTVFRVVRDQLKVSGGWVRCGRCSEVFNASLALLDLDTGLPWNPDPGNTAAARGTASARPKEGPRAPHPQKAPAPALQPPASPGASPPASPAASPPTSPAAAASAPFSFADPVPFGSPSFAPASAASSASVSAPVPAPVPSPDALYPPPSDSSPTPPADAAQPWEANFAPSASASLAPESTPGAPPEDAVAPAHTGTGPTTAAQATPVAETPTATQDSFRARAQDEPALGHPGNGTFEGNGEGGTGTAATQATGHPHGAAGFARQPAADLGPPQGSLEEAMSRHASDFDTRPLPGVDANADADLSTDPQTWRTTPMPAPFPPQPAEPPPSAPEPRPEDFYTRDTLPFDREQMLQDGAPPYVPPQRPAGLDRRPAPQVWPPLPPTGMELSQPPEMYLDDRPGGLHSATTPEAVDQPSFLRDAERARRWRQPRVRAALLAAALAASALLALQVLVTYRDLAAARLPALRPLLQGSCALLGCTVGPALAINSLVVESSGLVRSDKPNHYRLQVALRNRAGIAVALPAIDVTLTDTQGTVISRKVLLPTDMGSTIDSLPAGQSLTLQATLQNLAQGSGGEAGISAIAGYTVEVFYP